MSTTSRRALGALAVINALLATFVLRPNKAEAFQQEPCGTTTGECECFDQLPFKCLEVPYVVDWSCVSDVNCP